MARLYDLPFGQLGQLIATLNRAGMSDEDAKKIMGNDTLAKEWVGQLHRTLSRSKEPSNVPPDLQQSIRSMGLSTRATNILHRAGIRSIGDLAGYSVEELMDLNGFGTGTLNEINEWLSNRGLSLSNHTPEGRVMVIPGVSGLSPYTRWVTREQAMDCKLTQVATITRRWPYHWGDHYAEEVRTFLKSTSVREALTMEDGTAPAPSIDLRAIVVELQKWLDNPGVPPLLL